MTTYLDELEMRLGRQLVGDEHDLTAGMPPAGWLLGTGRPQGAERLLDTLRKQQLDPGLRLRDRLDEAAADLGQTNGVDLGLSLAQVQGLVRLARSWKLAQAEAEAVADLAESTDLDSAAANWLDRWQSACPQDPLDQGTLAAIAFPHSAAEELLVAGPCPAPFACELTPTAEDPLATLELETLLAGAADAGTAPEHLCRKINTRMTCLTLPGPLMGRVQVQRSLLPDWSLLLELRSPIAVRWIRFGPMPFHSEGSGFWRASLAVRPLRARLAAGRTPIRLELIDGSRIDLR